MSELDTEKAWLEECRRAFRPPPRRIGLWEKYRLRFPKPKWLKARDDFSRFFLARRELLTNGVVVWGLVIQANGNLFKPGPQDHGAEFVFSPDLDNQPSIEHLSELAHQLFKLKGTTQPQHDLAWIANYLHNERIRVFGRRVPREISPDVSCEISSVLVRRAYLPTRRLTITAMPLVISPTKPRFGMVLPYRYWPIHMVQIWKQRLQYHKRITHQSQRRS
ncbi:MAG TPA: hypothetical protein VGG19_11485 [Tepidisphaeraceae bacterium]|jgi:hypothetical protein